MKSIKELEILNAIWGMAPHKSIGHGSSIDSLFIFTNLVGT